MNSKLVLAIIVILLLLYVIFKALTTNYTTLGTILEMGDINHHNGEQSTQ